MVDTADQFLSEYAPHTITGNVGNAPVAPPKAIQASATTTTQGNADDFLREFAPETTDLSALGKPPVVNTTAPVSDPIGDPLAYSNPQSNAAAFGAPNVQLNHDLLPGSAAQSISRLPQRNPLIDVPAAFMGSFADSLTGRIFNREAAAPGSGAADLADNQFVRQLQQAGQPTTGAGNAAAGVGNFLGSIGSFLVNPAASGLAQGRANFQTAENQAFTQGEYDKAAALQNNKLGLAGLSGASNWLLSKVPVAVGNSLKARLGTGTGLGALFGYGQGKLEQATTGEQGSLSEDLMNTALGGALGAAGGAAPELLSAGRKVVSSLGKRLPSVAGKKLTLEGKVVHNAVPKEKELRLIGIEARIKTTEKALERATLPAQIKKHTEDLNRLKADRDALINERVVFEDAPSTATENIPEATKTTEQVSEPTSDNLSGKSSDSVDDELDILFGDKPKDVTSELQKAEENVTPKVSPKEGNAPKEPVTARAEYRLETTPAEINKKTFYHGTGTAGLSPDKLDSTFTKADSLFGKGLYLTDNPEIAKGYAKARGKKTGEQPLYQVKLSIKNVLNLEDPAPADVRKVLKEAAQEWEHYWEFFEDPNGGGPSHLQKLLDDPKTTTEQLWKELTEEFTVMSHQERIPDYDFEETFHIVEEKLRALGYDALTHTGGKRTGKDPHQVVILLEPQAAKERVSGFGKYEEPTPAAPTGQRDSTFLRSDKTEEPVKAGVSEDAKTYEKITLQGKATDAAARVDEMGLDAAEELVRSDKSSESVLVGMEVLKRFQKEGRTDKAIAMAETLMQKGTEAGQALSVFKIWDALGPQGVLKFAVKQVKKVQEEKIKDPLTRMLLDRELMAKVQKDIKEINDKHLPAAVDAAIEKMKKLANC